MGGNSARLLGLIRKPSEKAHEGASKQHSSVFPPLTSLSDGLLPGSSSSCFGSECSITAIAAHYNRGFLTFILPNSNWKTLGLVACAKTAGNNFVLGSTLNEQVRVWVLVKEGDKKTGISFKTTKRHMTEGD